MELKDALWEAMRGHGGITEVLHLLRDLSREMAKDQREIVQDERKANAWEKLSSTLEKAAEQSLPLLDIAN